MRAPNLIAELLWLGPARSLITRLYRHDQSVSARQFPLAGA
jgi:hypothetical protein